MGEILTANNYCLAFDNDDGDFRFFHGKSKHSSPLKPHHEKHNDVTGHRPVSSSSSTSPSSSIHEHSKAVDDATPPPAGVERLLNSLVDEDDPVGNSLLRAFYARKNQTLSMRRVQKHQQKKRQILADAKARFAKRKSAFSSMLKNDTVLLLKLLTRVLLIPMECRNLPSKPWLALRKRLPDEGFYPDIKHYVTLLKDIASTKRALSDAQLRLAFCRRLIVDERREIDERKSHGPSSATEQQQRNRSTNVENNNDDNSKSDTTGKGAARLTAGSRKKN